MKIVNNDAFRAVRDNFAGRTTGKTGLICDVCPTPFLMSYGSHLNRQVLLYSMTSALDALRHPIQRFRAARKKTALLPPATAADRASVEEFVDHAPVPVRLRRSS
jgi:hypothetical protein